MVDDMPGGFYPKTEKSRGTRVEAIALRRFAYATHFSPERSGRCFSYGNRTVSPFAGAISNPYKL
jgi:hypothetical protein